MTLCPSPRVISGTKSFRGRVISGTGSFEGLIRDERYPKSESTDIGEIRVRRESTPEANAPHREIVPHFSPGTNSAQTWLPNKSSPALDDIPKPYYCGGKKTHVSAVVATPALFGLAPMHSTRASAAHHRESISACQPDVRCSKP